MSFAIPNHARVLILGGGPGGSYTAACLAREGIQDVVVLEMEKFPRYHVGESMISAMRHFLRFIDLDSTFDKFGFQRKNGAAFKLNLDKKAGYTNFVAQDKDNYVWNVLRSQSDELLLRHAANSGARVFEGTRATEIEFKVCGSTATSKPSAVSWKNDSEGTSGRISFDFLVDATGRRGMLSTKYLQTRTYNSNLRNVACWGYWETDDRPFNYSSPNRVKSDVTENLCTPGGPGPYFEALSDESGWSWFIPVSNTKISVGIVMDQTVQTEKKQRMPKGYVMEEFYLSELQRTPDILRFLSERGAKFITQGTPGAPAIRTASDYSYSASSYAGENYRIVGDAGAFIDPFFSSGVHLALTGGLSAAATICAVARNECSPEDAATWHTKRVGMSYTRFLIVVMSAYRQIRSRNAPILADVDEDNFDRAFGNLRHVIQGTTDVAEDKRDIKVTASELERTLEYCRHVFDQTDEAKKIEVRKNIRIGSDMFSIRDMIGDYIDGRSMRLERGRLGLNKQNEGV